MSGDSGSGGWSSGPPAPGWGDQPAPGQGGGEAPPQQGWGDQPAPDWGGAPPPQQHWGAGEGSAPPPRRLRPLTLADVLDGMFRIFLAQWRTFAIALGVILVPLNFVTAVLSGMAGMNTGFWEQFANPASAQATFESGPDFGAFAALGAVSLLAGIFVNPFLNGVACRTAAETFEGGNPQPREVLRSTLQKYWSLIGVTFLVGLIAIGIMVVPVGLMVAGAVTGTDALLAAGGFLLLIAVPALFWLVIRFALVYPVVVVERIRPTDAMRRSYHLVRGRWWRVFGTVLLAGLVIGIVAQIAALPFALPGNVFGEVIGVVFVTIGSVIAAIITTPLTANVQTLLYFDGRIRSEGYDLEVMTRDVLGESPAAPDQGQPFG